MAAMGPIRHVLLLLIASPTVAMGQARRAAVSLI